MEHVGHIAANLEPFVQHYGVFAVSLVLAFESLGMLRVEFQTDADNVRSRTALARLGISEEGVLRRHQLRRDGSRRDTVVFSVIAEEWPTVRSLIDARLRAQT